MGGVLAYMFSRSGRPLGARFANNLIQADDLASYGIAAWGFDYGQIIRNVFEGSSYFGVLCGAPADPRLMTRFCAIVGNDMSGWTKAPSGFTRKYWLTTPTEGCLISPIETLADVFDQGKDNILLGRS